MGATTANPPQASPSFDLAALAQFVPGQSALWQTAILAIARRVAAAVGNADQLASDATSALAESLDFDLFGVVTPLPKGEYSIALSAVKFGVDLPVEPVTITDRPEDSLVAFALASGRLVSTPDTGEEKRYYDAVLRRCQANSAVACPLRSNGVVYGGILLANVAPRTITANDIACIETISHLVGAALARSRTEELLARAQLSVEAIEAVDAAVVMLDLDLRLLKINRCGEELTGFLAADVERREFCSAFVTAEEEATVNQAFAQLLSDGQPQRFEARLLRKHGDERRVEWRFRRLPGAHTGILLGAGADVTAKWQLEGQLAKLQQATSATPQTAAKQASADSNDANESGDGANRRKFPRRPYPYAQRMAPIRNGEMPGLEDFKEVECRDISAGGFSYYATSKPTENDIIVAFGAKGSETFLAARIMHVRPAVRNGKQYFAVGCQYTGRRQYST